MSSNLKRSHVKNGSSSHGRPPMAKSPAQMPSNKKTHQLNTSPVSSNAKLSGGVKFQLDTKLLLKTYDYMIQARVLEERLIRMYKQSQGYFWLGGPGEEAFDIPLGMQIKKGFGLDHDFMHFHYRASGPMLVMGMDPMDAMRQMQNTATDPFSGGRNFAAHFSRKAWNVVPVTSTIETQYQTAIGTAIAQKRHGGDAITIVTGGEAGTAEGDFASCLVWASRPKNELPLLILVTNNGFGISTPASTQHGEKHVADRGTAFGIKNRTINGNDVEESTLALREAMKYVREERKPYLLEAKVSRLYGHSSATGANLVTNEEDPIVTFEAKLEAAGIISRKEMDALREKYTAEMLEMSKRVKDEPMPDPASIYDHTYAGQKGRYW